MCTNRKKRLWAILVVGLLLVAGTTSYIQFFLVRPIGSGPAGPRVDPRYFAKRWTQRQVKLVGVGDSITAGLGAKSADHSFFNRLVRNPDDEYPDMRGICLSAVIPHLDTENLAVSGSTSQQHLDIVNERLSLQDPDVFGLVVLTTGGNDLIHNYGRTPPQECAMYGATLAQAAEWIEGFQRRLDTILDTITARFPGGCEIYLANIYDPTDGVGDAPSIFLPEWPDGLKIHARYNRVIAQCADARENVHLVDLYSAFLGHGSHCRQFWRSTYVSDDPYYWFFENVEDPNDRGHDAIRRVFLNTILKYSTLLPRGRDRNE
ncbi:MAG: SGNH/GDSL hydrolase family protein [Planctomycetota bacterium]|nr:MAG: SGNH/GDSL hydrolase family protein [Planctomycetota bacterium]